MRKTVLYVLAVLLSAAVANAEMTGNTSRQNAGLHLSFGLAQEDISQVFLKERLSSYDQSFVSDTSTYHASVVNVARVHWIPKHSRWSAAGEFSIASLSSGSWLVVRREDQRIVEIRMTSPIPISEGKSYSLNVIAERSGRHFDALIGIEGFGFRRSTTKTGGSMRIREDFAGPTAGGRFHHQVGSRTSLILTARAFGVIRYDTERMTLNDSRYPEAFTLHAVTHAWGASLRPEVKVRISKRLSVGANYQLLGMYSPDGNKEWRNEYENTIPERLWRSCYGIGFTVRP